MHHGEHRKAAKATRQKLIGRSVEIAGSRVTEERYHLYIDDTGSRDPDKAYSAQVDEDKMDCFGLGGILVKEADIVDVMQAHETFCTPRHLVSAPLTQYPARTPKIRMARHPREGSHLHAPLETYLLSLPIVGVACIIDRRGYVARYKDKYRDGLWFMCKTAFTILVERAAKYVDEQVGVMDVYFERSGRKEDRALIAYRRDLKERGIDFDANTSESYRPLQADDCRRLCLGKPQPRTKATPMIQIADLVLFAMAKVAYQPSYRPFAALKAAGKLIDCLLPADSISSRGIKYSCFDKQKAQSED